MFFPSSTLMEVFQRSTHFWARFFPRPFLAGWVVLSVWLLYWRAANPGNFLVHPQRLHWQLEVSITFDGYNLIGSARFQVELKLGGTKFVDLYSHIRDGEYSLVRLLGKRAWFERQPLIQVSYVPITISPFCATVYITTIIFHGNVVNVILDIYDMGPADRAIPLPLAILQNVTHSLAWKPWYMMGDLGR